MPSGYHLISLTNPCIQIPCHQLTTMLTPAFLQWFEERTQQIESLDAQLRKLHASMERLVNYRRDLALSTAAFAKATAVLSSVEEHSSLSRALHQLSESTERTQTIHHAQVSFPVVSHFTPLFCSSFISRHSFLCVSFTFFPTCLFIFSCFSPCTPFFFVYFSSFLLVTSFLLFSCFFVYFSPPLS